MTAPDGAVAAAEQLHTRAVSLDDALAALEAELAADLTARRARIAELEASLPTVGEAAA